MDLVDRPSTAVTVVPDLPAPDAPPAAPTHARAWAWVLAVSSFVGIISGSITIVDKIALLRDPAAGSFCDVNAQVGCTPVLLSWQSSVLGPPNALLGVLMFAVLGTAGLVAATGGRLSAPFGQAMVGLSVFFALFLTWYMQQVAFAIGSLCPFCTVCAAAVLMCVLATARMAADPAGNRLQRGLANLRQGSTDVLVVAAWAVVIVAMLFAGIWIL